MKINFYFLTLILFQIIKSKDFSVHFTRFVFSGIIIVIKVGEPHDTSIVHISMENDFSFFEFSLLNGTRSKSVKIINENENVKFYGIEKNVNLELREDIITFPYLQSKFNYSFYYMKKKIDFVYTSISLAHKFKDDKFNLIEQLYKNQIIDKKIFCIKHYGKSTGEIFFGDLNKCLNNSNKTYPYIINVNPNDVRWSFKLDMIYFKKNNVISKYYINSYYSYFDSAYLKIYVPLDFFNFLIENFFQQKFKEESCYISDVYNQRYKQIICQKMSDIPFENLTIVINGVSFELNKNDLFEEFGFLTYFLIELDLFNLYNFRIGTTFLLKYTSIFNYDSHIVELYSDVKLENINYKNFYYKKLISNLKKYLIYTTICINLIGILILM